MYISLEREKKLSDILKIRPFLATIIWAKLRSFLYEVLQSLIIFVSYIIVSGGYRLATINRSRNRDISYVVTLKKHTSYKSFC